MKKNNKSCQELSLTEEHLKLILAIFETTSTQTFSQKDYSKLIKVGYLKTNKMFKELKENNLIIAKNLGKRSYKYMLCKELHNELKLLTEKNQKITIDILVLVFNNISTFLKDNKYLNNIINNKLINKYNINISIEKIKKNCSKIYLNKNGTLILQVNEKGYTAKNFVITFIENKKLPCGKKYSTWKKETKGKVDFYRNPITGYCVFNIDFGKVKAQDPDDWKDIHRIKALMDGTCFKTLTTKHIRYYFRKFSKDIIFSKLFHIIDKIKNNKFDQQSIINPFRYLAKCFSNLLNNEELHIKGIKNEADNKVYSVPNLAKSMQICKESSKKCSDSIKSLYAKIGRFLSSHLLGSDRAEGYGEDHKHSGLWEGLEKHFFVRPENANNRLGNVSNSVEGY